MVCHSLALSNIVLNCKLGYVCLYLPSPRQGLLHEKQTSPNSWKNEKQKSKRMISTEKVGEWILSHRFKVSLAISLPLFLVVTTSLERLLTMGAHKMLWIKYCLKINKKSWKHKGIYLTQRIGWLASGCHVFPRAWITRLSIGLLHIDSREHEKKHPLSDETAKKIINQTRT